MQYVQLWSPVSLYFAIQIGQVRSPTSRSSRATSGRDAAMLVWAQESVCVIPNLGHRREFLIFKWTYAQFRLSWVVHRRYFGKTVRNVGS